MAKAPAFPALRETDLGIKDGPIDGAGLRDIFKRFFAQTNSGLDATNKSLSKGLTPGDNFRCDIVSAKATHAVAFTVRLKTLKSAATCLVTGGDTALPWPIASVQMLQPSQSGGIPTAQVTVYFNDVTATANVRLWLFEDGQQTTTLPTFNVQPAWIAPTFTNSWINYDTSLFQAAGYYKDSQGIVHLRGLVRSGTVTAAIFTLPSGYRPAKGCIFAVPSNDLFGECTVNSSGTVVASVGSNAFFSLDGITFDTR